MGKVIPFPNKGPTPLQRFVRKFMMSPPGQSLEGMGLSLAEAAYAHPRTVGALGIGTAGAAASWPAMMLASKAAPQTEEESPLDRLLRKLSPARGLEG